jgi:hypothetical protein
MTTLDNRPRCHYPGDTRLTVGQIVGPNTSGEWLTVDEVIYDPETNRSTAYFHYSTEADFSAMKTKETNK